LRDKLEHILNLRRAFVTSSNRQAYLSGKGLDDAQLQEELKGPGEPITNAEIEAALKTPPNR